MTGESKFIIGIGIITLILLIGGVFFLAGKQPPKQEVAGAQTADSTVLLANTAHTIGNQNNSVKIVEFADFQCPACAAAHPIMKKILEEYKDKVYFVYRHYPLPSHKNSKIAAQSAEAAGNQGKFWEMHDMIYENQADWAEKGNAKEIFEGYAQKLGLDMDQFNKDLDKGSDSIAKDYADGNIAGVNSTPTFFINGQKYPGVIQYDEFTKLINTSK